MIRPYLVKLQLKNPDNLSRFYADAISTKKGLVFLVIKEDGTILKWYTTGESVVWTNLPKFKPSNFNGWKIFDDHQLANRWFEGPMPISQIEKTQQTNAREWMSF